MNIRRLVLFDTVFCCAATLVEAQLPRAYSGYMIVASNEYNMAFIRRRIVSVENFIRTAKNGVYESYLLDNQLTISTAPLGETAAATSVGDNWKQRDQSVFSMDTSKERRTEIIEVRLTRTHQ